MYMYIPSKWFLSQACYLLSLALFTLVAIIAWERGLYSLYTSSVLLRVAVCSSNLVEYWNSVVLLWDSNFGFSCKCSAN